MGGDLVLGWEMDHVVEMDKLRSVQGLGSKGARFRSLLFSRRWDRLWMI